MPTNKISHIEWTSDMEHIISRGNEVCLWNIASGKKIFSYQGEVRLSPEGKCIATVSSNKTLQVWDVWNGKPLFTFPGLAGQITTLAWSPDSTLLVAVNSVPLVSTGMAGHLQIWQAS